MSSTRLANPHGGDLLAAARRSGRAPDALLDVSANLHPWGPPPEVEARVRASLADIHHYPPPRAEPLRDALSARIGVPVVVGNGATELLVAALHGCRSVCVRAPSYLGYAEAAELVGATLHHGVPTPDDDAVIVGRPNNPDGHLPTVDEVAALAARVPRVVVDESFLAFTDAPSCVGLAPNVVVVTSMTKTWAIPGLRLGWAWNLDPARLPPWTVNSVALAAGLGCLDRWEWAREVAIDGLRNAAITGLRALPGVTAAAGGANFVLVTLAHPVAPEVTHRMLDRHGILVRDASNFAGLDARHLRVAVGTEEENRRVAVALGSVLAP